MFQEIIIELVSVIQLCWMCWPMLNTRQARKHGLISPSCWTKTTAFHLHNIINYNILNDITTCGSHLCITCMKDSTAGPSRPPKLMCSIQVYFEHPKGHS